MCAIHNILQTSILYYFLNHLFFLRRRKILSRFEDINCFKVPIIGQNILNGLDLTIVDKRAKGCCSINRIAFFYKAHVEQAFEPNIELFLAKVAPITVRRTLKPKVCHLNYVY